MLTIVLDGSRGIFGSRFFGQRTLAAVVMVGCLGLLLRSASAEAAVRAVDASREAGIYEVGHTYGAYVHDFNADGRDDVLVNRHYGGRPRLYRNDGGSFTEVNRGTFRMRDPHHCDWADVDRDGLADVYCTVGGLKGGNGPNDNTLWLQQPNGDFLNRAAAYRVEDRFGRGRDTTFVDVNGDEFPDLYVGNAVPREDGRRGANQLFINVGGRRFRRAAGYGVNRPVGGESVQAADYDGDGDDDLLVCGKVGSARRLHLYRNRAGRSFNEVSRRTNARTPCRSGMLMDMNQDGRPDLVRVTSKRLVVRLQQRGAFRHAVARRRLRSGLALAAGDATGDGRPDLYVLQAGGRGGTEKFDLMLRNTIHRRRGAAFTRLRIPQTRRGAGDAVAGIDHDGNGLMDFLVMNGNRDVEGPTRLIAFERRP